MTVNKILTTHISFFKTENNLGGAITADEIVTATMGEVFADINSDEAEAGITKYACIYVKNKHTITALTRIKMWLSQNTPSEDTTVTIGFGTANVNDEEQTIANETTAPTGVTFHTAADIDNHLTTNDIPKEQIKAIWIKLVVSANATETALDNYIIALRSDTPA